MSSEKDKMLSQIESGSRVKLLSIDGGASLCQRLAAMGLVPGSFFEVMRNGHPGPFVVRIKQSKVVLGRGMADKIMVETA